MSEASLENSNPAIGGTTPTTMNLNQQKQKILEFLKTQILGVVSTIDFREARPESAVVAFSETENLEIIFGTFNDTQVSES